MKIIDLLLEHYVNVITPEDKDKYIDQVWDMLTRAYEPIGGFKSAESKEDLKDGTQLWKLVRKNGKIVSVRIYKNQHGRKSIALATDGSPTGKISILKTTAEDIKMNRSWTEASGAVESLLKKLGAKAIPSSLAQDLTGKEIIGYDVDGVHYTRLIQGEPHVKAIYGFPELTDEMKEKLEKHHLKINNPSNN